VCEQSEVSNIPGSAVLAIGPTQQPLTANFQDILHQHICRLVPLIKKKLRKHHTLHKIIIINKCNINVPDKPLLLIRSIEKRVQVEAVFAIQV
jgi:hypothetical protein